MPTRASFTSLQSKNSKASLRKFGVRLLSFLPPRTRSTTSKRMRKLGNGCGASSSNSGSFSPPLSQRKLRNTYRTCQPCSNRHSEVDYSLLFIGSCLEQLEQDA